MVEVKVKVKVKVSGQKEQKKTRKPRKDKGTKRGKKTKNPQFQTGSIDFRTIGTQQSSNATLLAGLIASRAVVPQYLQPQTSTELTTYAPRDLPRNIPPPQFRADAEQGQEEIPTTQVRKAMGERIGRLRKEEASLFLKGKVMEAKNMKLGEELRQKQHELVEQDKDMDLKRKSFLVEQIYGTTNQQGFARIQSQLSGLNYTGREVKEQMDEIGIDRYREKLIGEAGLDSALVDFREVKVGERGRGRKDWFYNPQKADLRRAQEEVPEAVERYSEDEEEEEEEPKYEEEFRRKPKPYKPEFLPSSEFIDKLQGELIQQNQESEIEKALEVVSKINRQNRQNEMEELAKTATSLDSKLGQRLTEKAERLKPKVAVR